MANPKGSVNSDFTINTLPQVKEEQLSRLRHSLWPPQQQHEEGSIQKSMAVKSELTEITLGHCQEQKQHQFIKSIDRLAALSVAIDNFKRRYDELQKHVNFIQNAIDAKLSSATNSAAPPLQIDTEFAIATAGAVPQPLQQTGGSETEAAAKSEPQRLCQSMCGRGLRRYVTANLSDAAKLREEIPAALKLAKNPARLVLDCIGRFYLQGRKAYTQNSPMIPARMASVLALECFLLVSGDLNDGEIEIESSVKLEAENAAIAWKKRLVAEGGLGKADEMDARGLLLLVASYGIPPGFRNEDLVELIKLSNSIELSAALRRSAILVPRIPGIIEGIMKRGMHVEAVDLAYTFGLEDKFQPQSILTSFLMMNNEAFERTVRKSHSPIALKDANEKQLAALKSVIKCLETRKIDPAKFLPGWHVKEQMIKLEKEIADITREFEEKAISRRRLEEIAISDRLYKQEIKRLRFSPSDSPLAASSYPHIYNDQRFSSHAIRDDVSALVNCYLAPSSSIPDGLGPGPLHDNRVSAYANGATVSFPTGSYSGAHRQSFPARQTSFGLQTVYGQPQSAEEFAGLPNYSSMGNSTSDLYG